jgi:exopolysaccharide biosynthesis protein
MMPNLPYRIKKMIKPAGLFVASLAGLTILVAVYLYTTSLARYSHSLYAQSLVLDGQLTAVSAELTALENEDQRQINLALEAKIAAIEKTYTDTIKAYEDLLDVKVLVSKTEEYDKKFAEVMKLLAKQDYEAAMTKLDELNQALEKQRLEIAAAAAAQLAKETQAATENLPANNTPPGSGYSRQNVQTDVGMFLVSIVAADLNQTKVIVDTAADGDCANDCPVLALGDYVGRSGGFAGVNGSYFCPASYPSCVGKTNSFDTLLMNKNKTYFNSDNNVYSTVPAVIFSGNSARFVGASSQWGRDTGVDAVIANHPLLVSGGNVVFGGDGDPKKGSKGPRGFIGASGSTVYIGIVHSATVAEAARVLQAMGVQNALNLDGGGSSALWSGGYKVGPGRALPNAIVLVNK